VSLQEDRVGNLPVGGSSQWDDRAANVRSHQPKRQRELPVTVPQVAWSGRHQAARSRRLGGIRPSWWRELISSFWKTLRR
jgi:hypothetical protein